MVSKDMQAWTDGGHNCRVLATWDVEEPSASVSVVYSLHSLNTHHQATSKAAPRYAGAGGEGVHGAVVNPQHILEQEPSILHQAETSASFILLWMPAAAKHIVDHQ